MTHQPEKKGFVNNKIRQQAVMPEKDLGFFAKLHNVNLLYLGSAVLQIVAGLIVVCLSILSLIQPLWVSAIMSLLGCMLTMAGLSFFYATIKDRKSVSNLVKDTIQRVIKDQN